MALIFRPKTSIRFQITKKITPKIVFSAKIRIISVLNFVNLRKNPAGKSGHAQVEFVWIKVQIVDKTVAIVNLKVK